MKNTLLLIVFLLIFLCGIYIGQSIKQDEIENRANKVLKQRAKKINTETITQQQLEIIIFNEPQL